MNTLTKVHVGVDVSKDMLAICIGSTNIKSIPNTKKGIRSLIKKLSAYQVERVAFESTGGYESLLINMLPKAGYAIFHIDPRRVKAYAVAKKTKAKTDPID